MIAGADGSPQKLIVSDWLKNGMGSGAVEDTTELTDIVNVKGDERLSLSRTRLVRRTKGTYSSSSFSPTMTDSLQ